MSKENVVQDLTRGLVDRGKLIAGGFVSFVTAAYGGPEKLSPDQLRNLRIAFFAGSQHVFGSITTMLEAGDEATDADMARMSAIAAELDEFIATYMAQMVKTKGNA